MLNTVRVGRRGQQPRRCASHGGVSLRVRCGQPDALVQGSLFFGQTAVQNTSVQESDGRLGHGSRSVRLSRSQCSTFSIVKTRHSGVVNGVMASGQV